RTEGGGLPAAGPLPLRAPALPPILRGRCPGRRGLPRPVPAAPLHPQLRPPPPHRGGPPPTPPGPAPHRGRPAPPPPAGRPRGPRARRRGRPEGAGRADGAGHPDAGRPGLQPPSRDRRAPPRGPPRAGVGIRLEEEPGVTAPRDRLGDYSTDRRVWTLS